MFRLGWHGHEGHFGHTVQFDALFYFYSSLAILARLPLEPARPEKLPTRPPWSYALWGGQARQAARAM